MGLRRLGHASVACRDKDGRYLADIGSQRDEATTCHHVADENQPGVDDGDWIIAHGLFLVANQWPGVRRCNVSQDIVSAADDRYVIREVAWIGWNASLEDGFRDCSECGTATSVRAGESYHGEHNSGCADCDQYDLGLQKLPHSASFLLGGPFHPSEGIVRQSVT